MKNSIITFLFAVSMLHAQKFDPVTVTIPDSSITLNAGSERTVTVVMQIEAPWHINSDKPHDESLIATKIRAAGNGIELKEAQFPAPHDVSFAFSDQPVSVFEGKKEIRLTLAAAASAPSGIQPVSVKLTYQACNDQSCLAPKTITAVIMVNVKGNSAVTEVPTGTAVDPPVLQSADTAGTQQLQTYAGAPASASSENSLQATLEKSGLAVSLLLIFLGGLALNLTPCVYPLIPITVGYFGGQSEGRTGRLFMLGLLYMLGMALTYSVIGVVTSLSGALFGTLLQNSYVIIGIAAVFVLLALSQFGVYEFNLPSSWMAAAGGAKGGAFGAFFMGLTMGIVAAPCIGPFVLGLVTFVAAKGDPLQGFLMFFVLALGLGLPYLVLALFSGKIKNLPRSGEWMEGVKHLFGFIMIGMALYFLEPVLPKALRPVLLPAFGVIAAAILLFADKRGNNVKAFRAVKTVLSVAIAALSIVALIPAEKHAPAWQPFTEVAFDASRTKQELIVIDFSAEWCIPCKELDALTFSDPEVISRSGKFTMYKADLTNSDSPEIEALAQRFSVKGVPTILIIDAAGNERERITGFIDAAAFLKKLDSVL